MSRDTLEALLMKEGYDLYFASRGLEALEKAQRFVPDLILLDVMLPGMDGFEVCRRLREDTVLAEVPILLVTSLDDLDSRIEGIDAGADEFISKPFNRLELKSRIRTITRLNRYRRILAEQEQRKQTEEALHESEREIRVLSSKLLDAQEMENKRIARELHDGLGQSLTAIKVSIEDILDKTDKNRGKDTVKSLETLIHISRGAIEEVRRISMNLRPVILDDLGILATISWSCREFQAIYPEIKIE